MHAAQPSPSVLQSNICMQDPLLQPIMDLMLERWAPTDADDDDDDGDDGPGDDDNNDGGGALRAPDADPYPEMPEPLYEAEVHDPKPPAETDLVVRPAAVPDHSLVATESPSPVASNMPAGQDLSSQPYPAQPTKPAFTKRLSVEDLSAKRARIRELSNHGVHMIQPT